MPDESNHEKRIRELERARLRQEVQLRELMQLIQRLSMVLDQARQTRETTF